MQIFQGIDDCFAPHHDVVAINRETAMYLLFTSDRYHLTLRLGRWELCIQPKASPFFCPLPHSAGPFAFGISHRDNTGRFLEATLELPLLAFHFLRH